jgi:hypothetical protein
MKTSAQERERNAVGRDAAGDDGQVPVDRAIGRLVVVWAVVLIPLAYGVINTVLKSVSLF